MNVQSEQSACHLCNAGAIDYSMLLDADDEVVLLDFDIDIKAENKRSLDIGVGSKSLGAHKFKVKELRTICFSLLGDDKFKSNFEELLALMELTGGASRIDSQPPKLDELTLFVRSSIYKEIGKHRSHSFLSDVTIEQVAYGFIEFLINEERVRRTKHD